MSKLTKNALTRSGDYSDDSGKPVITAKVTLERATAESLVVNVILNEL